MSTKAKANSNRRNAQRSTGPKTAEGKAASSRNATSHGLTSAGITVMTTEKQADLDALIQAIKDEWKPEGDAEAFYVDQMVQARWRLARLARFETEAFDRLLYFYPERNIDRSAIHAMETAGNPFDKLERYRAAAARAYSSALRGLTQLRANRQNTKVQNKAKEDQVWLQQELLKIQTQPRPDIYDGWELPPSTTPAQNGSTLAGGEPEDTAPRL